MSRAIDRFIDQSWNRSIAQSLDRTFMEKGLLLTKHSIDDQKNSPKDGRQFSVHTSHRVCPKVSTRHFSISCKLVPELMNSLVLAARRLLYCSYLHRRLKHAGHKSTMFQKYIGRCAGYLANIPTLLFKFSTRYGVSQNVYTVIAQTLLINQS